MQGKKEKCGVFGCLADYHVATTVYSGLVALQHRGQESAGIATFDGTEIRPHRGMGLVGEVFSQKNLQYLLGKSGIGHVRYSTTGSSLFENAQPLYFKAPKMGIAVAFNGNIVNFEALKESLETKGHVFTSTTDTEAIAHLFADELAEKKPLFDAMKNVMAKLIGAYAIVILTDRGKIIACRDPHGFKPLCLGKKDGAYIVSSESCALDALDAELLREVEPGEVILLSSGKTGMESRKACAGGRHAHCMFEYVYFARRDSVIEGKNVYEVRQKLGEALAKKYKLNVDMVIPIPDSGRSSAAGYAQASGIPLVEALNKNRYVHRTFITPGVKGRQSAVRLKLNPIKALIQGKKVALVDDSVVRGTTMTRLVDLVRRTGAKEVHLLVSCPPVIAPCYMGVDFPTYKELAAANNSVEEMRKMMGLDSLNYQDIDGLVKSIGLPKEDLCMACLTNQYPVPITNGANAGLCGAKPPKISGRPERRP